MSQILVIGTGYVGLVTAVSFAHLGHHVIGVDVDESRIATLKLGEPPFAEQRLDELLRAGLESGRLSFALPDEAAYESSELILLCLPTPQGRGGGTDTSAIRAAVAYAAPRLSSGTIVVNKSTVPVGTTRRIAGDIGRSDIAVVSNPEFLQEGLAISDFLNAERVVIGADDLGAANRVAKLYAATSSRIMIMGIESAELAKYACNAFLATKLSFVNSIASICELLGADIRAVTSVMGADSRIAPKYLNPGPGWGGSCLPKDTWELLRTAEAAGHEFPVLRATIESNEAVFEHVTERAAAICGGDLRQRAIGAWGLSFKAGTDDVRQSPALEIISRLQERGAHVTAFDPANPSVHGIPTAPDLYTACRGADLLVVLTEWPVFASADLRQVKDLMRVPLVLDTRGIIDVDEARSAGLTYYTLGRRAGTDSDASQGSSVAVFPAIAQGIGEVATDLQGAIDTESISFRRIAGK